MRLTSTLLSAAAALAIMVTTANAQVVVSSKIDTEGGVLGNIIKQVRVIKTPETRIYSDHYPIEMEMDLSKIS